MAAVSDLSDWSHMSRSISSFSVFLSVLYLFAFVSVCVCVCFCLAVSFLCPYCNTFVLLSANLYLFCIPLLLFVVFFHLFVI